MDKKAFTLIELLVVVAIIGILTTIVLANLNQAKAKSRDAKRVSDIAQLQLALEAFFDRCNVYPTSLSTGATSSNCPTGITLGTFTSKIPTPPTGSAEVAYKYAVNTTGTPTDYHLGATLESQSAALQDKAGFDSTGWNSSGGSGGFSGAASALIYDVRPR